MNNNIKPKSEHNSEKITEITRQQYISPTPGEIPLIAFNPVPQGVNILPSTGSDTTTNVAKILKSLQDGGLNAFIYSGTTLEMIYLSEQAEKYGISSILMPQWIGQETEQYTNQLIQFDEINNIKAWQLMDQPTSDDWEIAETGLRKAYDHVKSYEANNHNRATRMVYFNLAASEDNMWISDCGCYPGYLGTLDTIFEPSLWSYDLYPFEIKSNITDAWEYPPDPTKINIRTEDFYKYLACFAQRSVYTQRPFWAYCMCIAHKHISKINEDGSYNYISYQPAPTIEMLRYEAFSALAMGAQGLVFYRYSEIDGGNTVKFGEAPLKKNLTTSKVWDAVKTICKEIQKYKSIFLGAKLIGYTFKGEKSMELYNVNLNNTFDNYAKYISGKGVLITKLENNGKKYLVYVNQDPFNDTIINITYITKATIINDYSESSNSVNDIQSNRLMPVNHCIIKAGGYLIYEESDDKLTIIE